MRTAVKLAAAMLAGIPLLCIAQAQPKLSCVKDVNYNSEFLAKYPDAGAACQEVRVLQGEKWARFNGLVKSNKDSRITVQFLNTAKSPTGNALTFEYSPDATLTLENQQVKAASAVKKGDKIVVWLPESRFGLYAKPGAVDSPHFTLVSDNSGK
jgi:hypothetical protein